MSEIVVAGDVVIDWYQQDVPNVEREKAPLLLENFKQQQGFAWNAILGGAWLLRDFIKMACETAGVSATVSGHRPIDPSSIESADYLRSLATLAEFGEKDSVALRVKSFCGFAPPAGRSRPRVANWPDAAHADTLVIDDAANGARWDADFCDRLLEQLKGAKTLILKVSQPFGSDPLVGLTETPGVNVTTIVVTNASDLRAHAVDVSRRLSWEKTALDLVRAKENAKTIGRARAHESATDEERAVLGSLFDNAHVIVRLSCDGAVVFPRRGQPTLVFDPTGMEGSYLRGMQGRMSAGASVFVAHLAATVEKLGPNSTADRLAETLVEATCQACEIVRNFYRKGFIQTIRYGALDYPPDLFRLETLNVSARETFVSVPIPPADGTDMDWSIAADRATATATADDDLARSIVRYGRGYSLREVPTARFNELLLVDRREIERYRSVENLMTEYYGTRRTAQMPLSIGVFGPPGGGKSFGIKQMATAIAGDRIKARTFNLTQFSDPEDLAAAFHIARDITLAGALPLLIFDEFDCTVGDQEFAWMKSFLAPMQDGEFKSRGESHPIGPAIFVFVGGVFTQYSALVAEMNDETNAKANAKAKMSDFVSRLRGHLDVLGINPQPDTDTSDGNGAGAVTARAGTAKPSEQELPSTFVGTAQVRDAGKNKPLVESDRMCRVRRALLMRSQLLRDRERTKGMFPIINKRRSFQIDEPVLSAFLDVVDYLHGPRSLEAVLRMSRLSDAERFTISALPPDAFLLEHVDETFIGRLR